MSFRQCKLRNAVDKKENWPSYDPNKHWRDEKEEIA
jgi:hypothetical protein